MHFFECSAVQADFESQIINDNVPLLFLLKDRLQ